MAGKDQTAHMKNRRILILTCPSSILVVIKGDTFACFFFFNGWIRKSFQRYIKNFGNKGNSLFVLLSISGFDGSGVDEAGGNFFPIV